MTLQIPAADGPRGLSERSRSRLQGVHPDLIRVVERAAEIGPPFIVTEGLRSKDRQKELVRKGASRTLNSRHLTGHAVDVADVEATYAPQKMKAITDAIKQAAKDCGVKCVHGIDWGWDAPHTELDRKVYPASGVSMAERATQAVKVAASARVAAGAVAGGTAAATNPDTVSEAVSSIPAVPDTITTSVSSAFEWKSISEALWTFKAWAAAEPWQACFVVLAIFLAGLPVFLKSSGQSSAPEPSLES